MVGSLLKDLDRVCAHETIEVLLVLNIPEELPFEVRDFAFPLKIIRNEAPKGFGENHNASFFASTGLYFCVMNPDIRMDANPFPSLIGHFDDASVGLAAPIVVSPQGHLEDSARTFPTPLTILCKALGGCRQSSYVIDRLPVYPQWVGGMFMLFPSTVFRELGGFDPRYFLYYEDVDICARLTLAGWRIVLSPFALVIHHAQRTSRRRLQYLRWHLRSMLRFFGSGVFWRVHWRGLPLGKSRHCATASFRDKP
ncbi:MAG: glycosyltransferase family 2 protein [Rhodoferax sp.]